MKFKFTRTVRRRAACIGLSAAMCVSFAAGQITALAQNGGSAITASADEVYSLGFENANGKIDLTQIKIDNLSKQVMQNDGVSADVYSLTRTVIVTLEGQPLSERSYAGRDAREEIADEQQAFLTELRNAGISYEFRSSYASIANAVAIDVKLSTLSQIKKLKGVSTVSVGSTYERPKAIETTDGAQKNDSNIYATGIYDSSKQVEGGFDGSGTTVAILDTGLDYTHPAFTKDPDETNNPVAFTYEYVDNAINNTVAASDTVPVPFQSVKNLGATTDDVYISKKVPFAFDYADRDLDVFPSYSNHGTHVAGIVAGKADTYADKDGVEHENFRGVAPEAQLVICKVFTDNLESESIGGAEAVDILDALEDCYNLNVDVINMSLGSSAGFSSRALCPTDCKEDDEEGYLMKRIYQRIRDKGITLMVAASNDYSAGAGSAFGTNLTTNPDSGTVGSPSTYTGAMSVASINGQYSPYLLSTAYDRNGNPLNSGNAIYFEESRNEDSDAYDFVQEMLGEKQSGTFPYVVVPGTGEPTDYLPRIKRLFRKYKDEGKKVIAVIKRGSSQFKDKITTAMNIKDSDGTPIGADAVIVYNNVSGLIRMSLGDMRTRVPAISVNMEAGLTLTANDTASEGTVTIDKNYLAGPFMNDYSSWGSTPDLKLKPDVTAHGGEITSAVAGGYYDEMSGTSMACPNLAGFAAIFKGHLKKDMKQLWKADAGTDVMTVADSVALTRLTNNIIMSTAVTVYDQNKLPYSPRKQGAGLATLNNAFTTNAYLYTDEADGMCEDGRPKAELGEDAKKNGVYKIKFYVKNFGTSELKFTTNSIFMTETVGADKMSVAEKAHIFDHPADWKVNGGAVKEGGEITVAAGASAGIEVTLTLNAADKEYLKNFKNGMFVEGFLQLLSANDTQCDLTLPFMGFYGNWKAAPMMDLTCFDIAEDAKDTSLKDEDRAQPRVWATQPFGYYASERYTIPLGSFLYIQDEAKEHTSEYVYVEEEHIAISRDWHQYYGDNDTRNYLTTTGIKALYAGLLRNAEVVTYTLTNADTGEIIEDENGRETRVVFRANKAYAGGGSSMPSQVLLEMKPDEMGLEANGKYRLDFKFYFDYNDYAAYVAGDENAFKDEEGNTHGVYVNNSFSMNFYVDYEAPVLVDSRIRFQNLKDESNKDYQKVYLDLDIYDNHYPQAVILCYSEKDDGENTDLKTIKLATDYVVPVLNPRKNSINTVSIDISEFYEEYGKRLFVELDDYALNHNTYYINPEYTKTQSVCPADFTLTYQGKALSTSTIETIQVEKNTAVKLGVENIGNADLSNFAWSYNPGSIKVKNGEIFAVSEGKTLLTVRGGLDESGRQITRSVRVEVVDTGKTFESVSATASFGTVINESEALSMAQGMVKVSSGQEFTLKPTIDPWYYPTDGITWEWESGNPDYATVDQSGAVHVLYEGEYSEDVKVSATAKKDGRELFTAEVVLSIQPSFTLNGTTLTRYRGAGGELRQRLTLGTQTFENVRVLKFPEKKTVLQIGEEAFKDCKNVEVIIIPKGVTTIGERAFEGCENLKAVCFVQETELQNADSSSLTLISKDAFAGCENLAVLDLTNCKLFTVDRNAFGGCTGLKEVVNMRAIGTVYDGAFAGCTALQGADISNLHVAGNGIFEGCTALTQITTGNDTALGVNMFRGCTNLEQVEIKCPQIGAGAFAGCTKLNTVSYTYTGDAALAIGARAFENCSALTAFNNANSKKVGSIGDYAFRGCTNLASPFTSLGNNPVLGYDVFDGVLSVGGASVTDEGTLVLAPSTVDSGFATELASGSITAIGPNAFSVSHLASGVTSLDLSKVTALGKGALRGLTGLQSVTLCSDLTEIPDYAFGDCADLTQIVIPAGVTRIGANAFNGCTSLASVNFGDLTNLNEIGAGAFYGVAITTLNLPDSVKTVGNEAFAGCASLTEATVNAVKMGTRVFALCPKLATVTFGDNAESTGNNTFSTAQYGYDAGTGEIGIVGYAASALTSVEFGVKIDKIGDGVFDGCNKLTQIDIKNVKSIGVSAFANCALLETVTGIEKVTAIGAYAFENCAALKSLNLSSATAVHACAFQMASALATVTFGDKLEGIGDYAFYGTAVTQINIPASCTYIGGAAFAFDRNLTAINVAAENANYFDDNGVLYRYIDRAKNVYELTAYPAGKNADKGTDSTRTYRVIDGTVSLLDYSFNAVEVTKVYTVILPYSLKVIGHGAFLNSTISVYQFESIQAPTLLQGVMDRVLSSNSYSSNSFFYINFGGMSYEGTYLTNHTVKYPGDTTGVSAARTISIKCPANGTGYDNYIYNGYFGTNKATIGEMPLDSSRTLKDIIENFAYDVATISGWNKGNVSTDTVKAFSETVKQARILCDDLKTDAQKNFVGQANISKLEEVEGALKDVKPLFGLQPSIDSVVVDSSSTHRTAYTAGERFSVNGVKLRVNYDDRTYEVIDVAGNFKLRDSLNRALRVSDRIMTLEGLGDYSGKSVRISITVAESAGENPGGNTPAVSGGDNGGNKISAGVIAAIVAGAVVVLAAAAVAVVIVLKKRGVITFKGGKKAAGAEADGGEEVAEDNNQQENSGEDKTDD